MFLKIINKGLSFVLLFFYCQYFYGQREMDEIYYNDSSLYDVKYYHINIEASADTIFINGFTEIGAVAIRKTLSSFFIQIHDSLKIDSVLIENYKLNFLHKNNWLKVYLPPDKNINVGNFFKTKIFYKGNVTSSNYMNFSNITAYNDYNIFYTLSEPFSSLDFYACKQYLTDKADSAIITVTTPTGQIAVSNGLLCEKKYNPNNNKVTWIWKTHYPIAYYLISITISNYKEYTYKFFDYQVKDSVLYQNFIYNDESYFAENKDQIDDVVKVISYFEQILNYPYPFYKEKYGQVNVPISGGMENQTITTLSDFSFALVTHELAHSWFGNLVTCSNWQDIWINEGFATYLNYLAVEHFYPENKEYWLETTINQILKERDESIYVPEKNKYFEPRIFNYRTTYLKGAMLIHMIRNKIGNDNLFFGVLSDFLKKYAYRNAGTNEFISLLEEKTNTDWHAFFNQWYYGSGYPIISAEAKIKLNNINLSVKLTSSFEGNRFSNISLPLRIEFDNNYDTTINLILNDTLQEYTLFFNNKVKNIIGNYNKTLLAQIDIKMTEEQIEDTSECIVYPNPSKDCFWIGFPKGNNNNKEVFVYDTLGKSISKYKTNKQFYHICLPPTLQGIFYLEINDGIKKYKSTLIKIDNR